MNLGFGKKHAAHKSDARIEIKISDDKLNVHADFYPALGDGKILERDYVDAILINEKIVYGVDWDIILDSIFKCNTDHKIQNDVLIAKGKLPVRERPEFIKLDKLIFRNKFMKPDEKSIRIDYKKISPYLVVRKGQVLAYKIPMREGTEGINVFGESIPFVKKEVIQLENDINTAVQEDKIIAETDGLFVTDNKKFWIEESLHIKGDVDYHTGHIVFPGDVTIDGVIKEGFHIVTGGSLLCKETMDASDIACAKDLTVNMGIKGRHDAVIKVGGSVKTKFIENCLVEAKGSINVSDSIYSCKIFTTSKVLMGDHGRIVGSKVSSINGVEVSVLGNKAGQSTVIECGVDFVNLKKLEYLNKKYETDSKKLRRVEEYIQRENTQKLQELKNSIETELKKINISITQISGQIDVNEHAVVKVKDTVYPGTVIRICRIEYVVKDPEKSVIFTLDKTKGKIFSEKIKK